ncbi:MAG: sulfatase-like hydrolase/transferase, partial [Planctomycetaceae bacterium]|nr:sulfatase-like hydrolase/transferase [Planctomycetaceae bacterium]
MKFVQRGSVPLAVLIVAACLVGPDGAATGAERPHIVCIMADDLGWQDLHCQGNSILQTPELDALAAQGARFTDAYAAAPVCSPTRAALMTGLAPGRLHITQHGADGPRFWPEDRKVQPPETHAELSLSATTLAERLRDAGYATGFFGKWHLGSDRRYWPTEQGFDVNVG